MGVSIGQQLKRCSGYSKPKEIEARDCDCRLLRAQVYFDRREFDRVQVELDMAKVLAIRSNHVGWKKAVREAQATLEKARSAKSK
jgi:hypothetical protein